MTDIEETELHWHGDGVLRGFWGLLVWAATSIALGSAIRTQSVDVQKGWNAIYLEVQPTDSSPARVFGGLPVESVACFLPGSRAEKYLRSPGDAVWKEEGWVVWHAPTRSDAFLSNLHDVQSGRAYLILAASNFTWQVSGASRWHPLQWQADNCSFTGLPVDPDRPPTFADFFHGSPAHQRLRIYRMVQGDWKLVAHPGIEKVRQGEAYWIQSDGASTHQGPLEVRLDGEGLVFGSWSQRKSMQLINRGRNAAAIQIESTSDQNGGTPLLYHAPRNESGTPAPIPIRGAWNPGRLLRGSSMKLVIGPDRSSIGAVDTQDLLRVSDGSGTLLWIPVQASRDRLTAETQR